MSKVLAPSKKYWCLNNSLENSTYGDYSLQEPWQGILYEHVNPFGATYSLHRFSDEDKLDHDPNASCHVGSPDELFDIKQEADIAYINLKGAELIRDGEALMNKSAAYLAFQRKALSNPKESSQTGVSETDHEEEKSI